MSEERTPQILTPAQQEKLADWQALEEFLGIGKAPRHSAPTGQINPDSAGQGMEADHG